MPQAEKIATTADDAPSLNDQARLIDLLAQQITVALKEAITEINGLTCSVLDIARHAGAVLAATGDSATDSRPAENAAKDEADALQRAVQNSCMQLQFADRMNQRLSSVSTNLAALAQLMVSSDVPITNSKFADFLGEVRATYTTEDERQMFDAVFKGLARSIQAAAEFDATQRCTFFDGDSSDDR